MNDAQEGAQKLLQGCSNFNKTVGCSIMSIRKADYKRIANTFDAARTLPDEYLGLWIKLISKKIDSQQKVEFLDLACGTGRFSIPIATRLGYSVTGADKSEEMLREARKKEGEPHIRWDLQDATSLSYSDGSFDAVFMSHLLHHVDEPLKVVKECYRVLRPGGVILNRYGAIEHIRDDPEHRFFPETIQLDEARVPSVEQVEKWFMSVGFTEVSSETVVQQTFRSAEERLRKAELKSISALIIISQSAFKQGLEALRKYVSSNSGDPWLLIDKITLTTGRK